MYSGYRRSGRKQRAWASDNPGNIAIRAELVEAACQMAAAELAGDGDVLDVGCGTGWWLEALMARGVASSRLHGIDLLAERARAAQARLPGATVVDADARALPYEDGRFSLVTLFTTASSLASRQEVRTVLCEASRVARDSGLVLVYEARVGNPLNRNTVRVRQSDVQASALSHEASRSLTVLPPLIRRLARGSAHVYPRLGRIPGLRTHYLLAQKVRKAR